MQGYLLKDEIRNCKLLTRYIFEKLHKPIHIYNFLPDLEEKGCYILCFQVVD
jgi:hypothetical protein